jgi:uncharacterized membrane protein YsdA (DUF1294 family)/cold shock CspA family protein
VERDASILIAMRSKGTIVQWRDDRGFGFIEPRDGGERVFCHINAFAVRVRRPAAGDSVTYSTAKDKNGRLHATQVRPAGLEQAAYQSGGGRKSKSSHASSRPRARSAAAAYFFISLFAAALVALVVLERISLIVPLVYLAVSGVTVLAYWFDKRAAMKGGQRTPEQTLHLFELLCGWPGALLAQNWFRHKSSKTSFRVAFWVCVIVNLAALAVYAKLVPSPLAL